MPAIAPFIPLIVAAGGMIGQNVENKRNQASAESAKQGALNTISGMGPGPANAWGTIRPPSFSGPQSFGGGSIGGPSGSTFQPNQAFSQLKPSGAYTPGMGSTAGVGGMQPPMMQPQPIVQQPMPGQMPPSGMAPPSPGNAGYQRWLIQNRMGPRPSF